MKALLHATGEYDNLYPLTEHYASPMLPVANRPVITYSLELMVRHQFRDIFISLLHRADSIETYCERGHRWNVNISYLLQREALGNAGALLRAASFLTETFLLLPGDAIVDVDLMELCAFHRTHGGIATAVLAPAKNQGVDAPVIQIDSKGQVFTADRSAGSTNGLAYTNVFIFEPRALEYIPDQGYFDCQADLLPRLLEAGEVVYGYDLSGYWNTLDTFAMYQGAQEDCLRSITVQSTKKDDDIALRHPYVDGAEFGSGIWRGAGTIIHPSAQLLPPVLIGAGSQIGANTIIGPDVVLGQSCIIDDGATIEASTILPDTYVGQLVRVHKKFVDGSVFIDIDSNTHVDVIDPALLGRAGTQVANALLRHVLGRMIALLLLASATPILVVIALIQTVLGRESVFLQESYIGGRPMNVQGREEAESTTIKLLHLRTRKDDGTHIGIGRWLEQWEVQRLPELINVVLGEFALVGVKPLTLDEYAGIGEAWQHRRFDCPAGFTGRWYTEVTSCPGIDELVVADVYQTAMQSSRDSLQQILKTPLVWWTRGRVVTDLLEQRQTPLRARSGLPHYVDNNPLK